MPNHHLKGRTARVTQESLLAVIIILLCLSAIPTVNKAASPDAGRFFLMGDGLVHIRNTKTGREANVSLYLPDGSLNEKGFLKIDDIFGFPTSKEEEHISPRLLSMIDYFSDLLAPGKVINLDSGYRSPTYNTKLRYAGGNVAKTSEHMDGMAADFNIDGVDGKRLWQLIKEKDCCGVGYYGGRDIHLDSGRPRYWEATTSKVRTGASDFNRKIYLSTDFDRYRPRDRVRLSLSSISDFFFGLKRTINLVNDQSGEIIPVQLTNGKDNKCIMINSRKEAHLLFFNLPTNLPNGKYRVKMTFCRVPFQQMPAGTLSNKIEVAGQERKTLSQ